jgi:hypothetical protein
MGLIIFTFILSAQTCFAEVGDSLNQTLASDSQLVQFPNAAQNISDPGDLFNLSGSNMSLALAIKQNVARSDSEKNGLNVAIYLNGDNSSIAYELFEKIAGGSKSIYNDNGNSVDLVVGENRKEYSSLSASATMDSDNNISLEKESGIFSVSNDSANNSAFMVTLLKDEGDGVDPMKNFNNIDFTEANDGYKCYSNSSAMQDCFKTLMSN